MTEFFIRQSKLFFRYFLAGLIVIFVDFAVLYALVDLFFMEVVLSSAIAFALANITSFVLNKFWTFKNKSRAFMKIYFKFLLVSLIGLAMTVSLMYCFVKIVGLWYIAAKVLVAGIVVIWNFLANQFWTFKEN